MVEFLGKLMVKINERQENNAFPKLPVSHDLLDLAFNDYLGLAKSEAIFNTVS
ncbi:MAG: hypothetical protein R3243_12335 [Arenibacter latericius]|nr:hypothetical protein [Arenibacter latericius]